MTKLKNPIETFKFDAPKDASDPSQYAPAICRSARKAAVHLAWHMHTAMNNLVSERGTEVAFQHGAELGFTYRVRAYQVVINEQIVPVYVAYLADADTGCGGETIFISEFDHESDTIELLEGAVQDYAIWDRSFDEYAAHFEMLEAA